MTFSDHNLLSLLSLALDHDAPFDLPLQEWGSEEIAKDPSY